MSTHRILGIHLTDRVKEAAVVQKLFTEYGCNIKTRLGLHEVSESYCAPHGLILLETVGDDATLDEFERRLTAIEGLQVQKMVFTHG
jgi:hypothetical protein